MKLITLIWLTISSKLKVVQNFIIVLILFLTSIGCAPPVNSGLYRNYNSYTPLSGNNICALIAGASIVAHDGEFLGELSSEFASRSVLNQYGNFGSQYSSTSIWNTYGQYGGKYSDLSPFNGYTNTPPMLLINGKVVAYLTVNKSISNGINPYVLKTCEFY